MTTDCSRLVVRFVVRFFALKFRVLRILTTRLQRFTHAYKGDIIGDNIIVVCSQREREIVLWGQINDYKVTTNDYKRLTVKKLPLQGVAL